MASISYTQDVLLSLTADTENDTLEPHPLLVRFANVRFPFNTHLWPRPRLQLTFSFTLRCLTQPAKCFSERGCPTLVFCDHAIMLWHCWLGGRKGIRPAKKYGGWWRWALLSPDGVASSRIVGVSASVNLPLHHKVQKFSSRTGSPGWSWKKGRKTVVVW